MKKMILVCSIIVGTTIANAALPIEDYDLYLSKLSRFEGLKSSCGTLYLSSNTGNCLTLSFTEEPGVAFSYFCAALPSAKILIHDNASKDLSIYEYSFSGFIGLSYIYLDFSRSNNTPIKFSLVNTLPTGREISRTDCIL